MGYVSVIALVLILSSHSSGSQILLTNQPVTSDSNVDGIANIGNSGSTSYIDASTYGGTSQQIQEVNTAVGLVPVTTSSSNVDNSANLGTYSAFDNAQTVNGQYTTLTESKPSINTNAISTNSSFNSDMLVGDGSPHWGTTRGTISFWIYFKSFNNVVRPWGESDNFEMRTSASGIGVTQSTIGFDFGGSSSLTTSTSFSLNTWYFLAVTWNEGTSSIKVYVGTNSAIPNLDNSNTAWTSSVTSYSGINTFMGSGSGYANSSVYGYGDDLRYYSIDRSLSSLQSDYKTSLIGNEQNLRSYFRLDGNYIDSGPNHNDGTPVGTSFTTNIPTFTTSVAKLDLEAAWNSLSYLNNYAKLAIYTGALDTETLSIDYWTGSSWSPLISSLQANSWNNVTITNYITSSSFVIRYRDGNQVNDYTQSSWQIDAMFINLVNYQLQWEHQVNNVPTNKEYYFLTIYGYSSGTSESFQIQLWNQTSLSWTNPLGTAITSTSQWYNISISGNGIINSAITWRYIGNNETYDNVQNTLTIVYAGIKTYDQPPQFVSTPSNIQYNEGTTGHSLSWTASDANPRNYTIYQNGSISTTGTWQSNVAINYNVDNLALGSYNYTIIISDTFNHTITNTVWVTVLDVTKPNINSPNDISFDEGATGNSISWTVSDLHPANYIIYQNGTNVQSNAWISGNPINYNLDNLVYGNYNFTIIAYDTSGNYNTDMVIVNVLDVTPPTVSSPANIQYEEGNTGNTITWTISDAHPATYSVYRNNTLLFSSSWSSGSITISVDGLKVGNYNYTIVVLDQANNIGKDSVSVSVVDTISPTINNPLDIIYEGGSTGNQITWVLSDNNPDTYSIFKNGTLVNSNYWTSGKNINYTVDGLPVGVYNYTIIGYDTSGNYVTDTVYVTVVDTTAPVLSSPSDIQYFEGSTGHSITWSASDYFPSNSIIYRNNSIVFSNSWTSGNIGINIDGLSLGVYNYTIVVYDTSGNKAVDTVIVTVIDDTSPVVNSPSDITYPTNSLGNTIDWIGTDLHPATYIIYQNGTNIASSTWISSGTISISVDGLPVGVYNYTIVLYDTSGNTGNDTVYVKVTSGSVFTKTPSNIYYVYGTTGNQISWTVSDSNPNMYVIYKNGTAVANGTWTNEIPIVYNIDGLNINTYNFTIFVNDTDGNFVTNTAYVIVSDMPVWHLVPGNSSYFEGSTGNILYWNATDMKPDTYVIYRNGTVVGSGTWDNATDISLNIDGLSIGIYNFTILVNDTVNNIIQNTVYITVIDNTPPGITSPLDFSYEEGSTGISISWTPTDLHPSTYIIYQNGSNIQSNSWTSGNPISINIDGLTLGVYNYTIIVYDTSGNSVIDTVIITVVDTTNPVISHPSDITFGEGTSTGNYINWTITDRNPATYTIYQNGVVNSTNSWTSGSIISLNIDNLKYGTYNFTIIAYDTSGNYIIDQVNVTITDITPPIISSPSDFSYDEGITGNNINWLGTDLHPTNYIIYQNGTNVQSSTWTSGISIIYSVDGLSKGTYNFTIVLKDVGGNQVTDTVMVTVLDVISPTINSPSDFSFTEGTTNNYLTWTPNDLHPATYIIYQNKTNVQSNTWISGNSISINLDSLSTGTYNFTIIVYDTSGNYVIDTVNVKCLDLTPPTISSPSDFQYTEEATGNSISWSASDTHPNSYFVYLNTTTLYASGTWSNGVNININVDGLSKNVYNFTIIVYDASGNSNHDTVIVTVVDLTPPTISTYPTNMTNAETQNYSLEWIASDLHAANYIIYQNGTNVQSNTWISGNPVYYNITTLAINNYNITIQFFDASGNYKINTVFISVRDLTPPTINQIGNTQYEEGTTGHSLTWNPYDLHPNNYIIYKDGVLNSSSTWSNGNSITLGINGLTIGNYNFTIIVYDQSGNYIVDKVNVFVYEVTPPTVTPTSGTQYFDDANSATNNVTWSAYDLHPGSYSIYKNGSLITSGIWTDGTNITLSLNEYTIGAYNITLVVKDTSLNQAVSKITIVIADNTNPVLISWPQINSSNTTYSNPLIIISGTTGNTLQWIASDLHPYTYSITDNGNPLVSNVLWRSNNPITINIDNLGLGNHTLIIIISDASGNIVKNTVYVYIADDNPPTMTYTSTPSNTTSFAEGSTGQSLNWNFTDVNPNTYMIYLNGTPVYINLQTWSNPNLISYAFQNINKGVYNYTIVVYDKVNNFAVNTVIVTVFDGTPPTFTNTPSSTLQFTEGTPNHILSWTMNDNYPDNYNLYQNGTLVNFGNWQINVPVSYNITSLAAGTYNFTIIVYDTSMNSVKWTVIVTVYDKTNPIFTSIPLYNYTFTEGTTGNNLTWIPVDLHPYQYTISQDGVIIQTGTWTSNNPISINIDNLSFGTYNFTIIITDQSNNIGSNWVYVTVKDLTPPTIISAPIGYTFNQGQIGNTLKYNVTDRHPGAYIVYLNDTYLPDQTFYQTNNWQNNVTISINIDYDLNGKLFIPGYYTFTVYFYDQAGNFVINYVTIRVKDPNITDTLKPNISLKNQVFEGDVQTLNGTWLTANGQPINNGTIVVSLYLQTKVFGYTTYTFKNGSYYLTFNYTNLATGSYYWSVSFSKNGYQAWPNIRIPVKILPHTYRIEIDAPTKLTQGSQYYISAIVYYNDNNQTNTALSLNSFYPISGRVKNVEVSFTVRITYQDGSKSTLTKVATSDANGVALVFLTQDQTSGIKSVDSITVQIAESNLNNGLDATLPVSSLPTISQAAPNFLTNLINLFLAYLTEIIIAVAALIVFFIIIILRRRKELERIRLLNESIKFANEEFQAVRSIQSIIIQTSSKLTVYEEQIADDTLNTNLVGGMVTAFSSFLNEIGKNEMFGFEMMEREDVSLTVHKAKYSNFIVISKSKLPYIMLSQIQDAQDLIENQYKDYFTNTERGVRKLLKIQVHPLFHKASFKMALTQNLELNIKNMDKLMKEKVISRALKQNIRLLEDFAKSETLVDNKFQIRELVEFFKSRNISDKVSSRLIILAYEFNIILPENGNNVE